MRLPLAVLIALVAAAPAGAQETAAAAPAAEAPVVPAVAASDAPRRARSLYADLRAFQVGDLVTVVLAERTTARRASASQASASATGGPPRSSSTDALIVRSRGAGARAGPHAVAGGPRSACSCYFSSGWLKCAVRQQDCTAVLPSTPARCRQARPFPRTIVG